MSICEIEKISSSGLTGSPEDVNFVKKTKAQPGTYHSVWHKIPVELLLSSKHILITDSNLEVIRSILSGLLNLPLTHPALLLPRALMNSGGAEGPDLASEMWRKCVYVSSPDTNVSNQPTFAVALFPWVTVTIMAAPAVWAPK